MAGINVRELTEVVAALARRLEVPFATAGGGVWQPARDRLVLGARDGLMVAIVPRGAHARLHSVELRPENPKNPFSFQSACRARLRGRWRGIAQTPGEREVTFAFDEGRLVARFSGPSGGLWLLDDAGAVVASIDGPAPAVLPPLPDRPPRPDAPRFGPADGDWDLGARAWFEAAERRARADALRAEARRALAARLDRHRRLLENLAGDLDHASAAPAVRHRAELVAANLWRLPRSAAGGKIEIEDWDTGESVVIALPDGTTPAESAERWFAQAKRLDRAGEQILARMDEVERALAADRAALDRLDDLDEAALGDLPKAPPPRGKPREAPALPWVEWLGPHDRKVLIGRNEAGNRRLVFQRARGHDWWMHLRDRPSAHAVLPTPRGESPPLEHLLAAAGLLLAKSGFEDGDAAEVQYARVANVRPVPGEIARVTVTDERVLRVTLDRGLLRAWTSA